MAKVELKTKETAASVEDFLNGVEDENARADCWKIVKLMSGATNAEPKMWGTNIIGFGSRLLKYESGRELDWMEIGFSPRTIERKRFSIHLVISATSSSSPRPAPSSPSNPTSRTA